MKHFFIISGLMIFSLGTLQAQESSSFKHVVSTNPILTSFGWLNVTYEGIINEKSTFVIMGDVIVTGLSDDFFAAGLGAGYRRYFTYKKKAVPEGFYIQPQVRALIGGENASIIIPGFELGYQWVWDSGFSLNLGLGPGIYITDGDAVSAPTGTLVIGYAW